MQPAQVAPPSPAAATPPAAAKEEPPPFKITPLGYVEAYYAYNFNRPANGLTNFRGFDNRHNTFSLSNVALGASFEGGPITGKLVLQVGSTPSTYYLGEPALSGSSGANATSSDLWKYLQEAHVGY
ncbi:MAG TPA: outer membrane beta-barrel protein, partial [Polyangiaceae bacterium]